MDLGKRKTKGRSRPSKKSMGIVTLKDPYLGTPNTPVI